MVSSGGAGNAAIAHKKERAGHGPVSPRGAGCLEFRVLLSVQGGNKRHELSRGDCNSSKLYNFERVFNALF